MKKKSFLVFILVLVIGQGALVFAQTPPTTVNLIDDFKKGFQQFSDDVASVLPMNSTIGLNWSDAYIGQLIALPPSLGVGITAGVTGIPYDSVKKILVDTLKGDDNEIPSLIKDYGLPLPAMAIDARLGGFILPFDIGFKFGFVPKTLADQVGDNIKIDFLLVGGDIRYLLMKQRFVVIPEVSVGVGYNYLKGSVEFGGVLPNLFEITLPEPPPGIDSCALGIWGQAFPLLPGLLHRVGNQGGGPEGPGQLEPPDPPAQRGVRGELWFFPCGGRG
jgi:hypothetical protein